MPRKTAARDRFAPPAPIASMRPRPDAAENLRDDGDCDRGDGASMRPRPDAAENGVPLRRPCRSLGRLQ